MSKNPPAASTSAVAGYSYVPPTTLPPLMTVVGTDCTVATDRSYSIDNIWVKSLSTDTVAVGITTTMVEIIYQPYNISLSPVGTSLAKEDDFGAIEGYKLSSDLISPISGTVIQINNSLIGISKSNVIITPINDDPYNAGWLIIVRLSNPAELNFLLSAQSYMDLPQVSNGRATGIA
jgi:glycine cleavage system H protein